MARIEFESLFPEFFTGKPTWMEFMEALADTIQQEIRDPIQEIEDIRHIISSTDSGVVAQTIKQLGFDIPQDLIAPNMDRLAKSVYMLALFHERSGTDDFVKGIRFVLGRNVEVSNTFTSDYESFYERPHGPLLIDGGDWFKTTHVNLYMEVLPTDVNMVLPVEQTLADRLIAAYYEFAPINHVVRNFYFTINTNASLGFAGQAFFDNWNYLTIRHESEPSYVETQLPRTTESGSTVRVTSDVSFDTSDCYQIPNPVFGTGLGGVRNAQDLSDILTSSLSDKKRQTFSVSAQSKFVYFACAQSLGAATFDSQWIQIESVFFEVQGRMRPFNVYRTATPVDDSTFTVDFEFAGRQNSCDSIEHNDKPENPDTKPNDPECRPDTLPIFGSYDAQLDSNTELEFLQHQSDTEFNQRISISAEEGQYGYFAYPVGLGHAEFVEVGTGIEGGWDGASWPDTMPDSATSFGPTIVIRNQCGQPYQWYVYRTDVPGPFDKTFDVSFDNPEGSEPETTPEQCASGYPTMFVGDEASDIEQKLLSEDAVIFGSTRDTTITVELDQGEVAYLAYPLELGQARITSGRNVVRPWSGPTFLQRGIAGKYRDWFVYRTTANALPRDEYSIRFANAGHCVIEGAYPPTETETETHDPENPESENPTKEQRDCYVNGLPVASAAENFDPNSVTLEFNDTQNATFSLSISENEYGWFAYPVALGYARFVDVSSSFEGGWDGAKWKQEVGTEEGPSIIQVERAGITSPWYLYRTDFYGLGDVEYSVSFENNVPLGEYGNCNQTFAVASVDSASLYSPMMALQSLAVQDVADDSSSSEGCLVSGKPFIGSGNNVDSEQKIRRLSRRGETQDFAFSLSIPEHEYGWFAYPAALGEARFIDRRVGIEGGWSGATWPEGSTDFSSGPVRVPMSNGSQTVDWLVYRTDFPGLGQISFEVQFVNKNLVVGNRFPCNAKDYPRPTSVGENGVSPVTGTGPAGLRTSQDILEYLDQPVEAEQRSFDVDAGKQEYVYFAHPAYLGQAQFNRGVTWLDPVPVYRYHNGVAQGWYLYRTEIAGLGAQTITYDFAPTEVEKIPRKLRVTPKNISTDRPDIVTFDEYGRASFAPVFRDTDVNITTYYGSMSHTKTITVRAKLPELHQIELRAPDEVAGSKGFDVEVFGHFADGSILPVVDAEIRVLSQFVQRVSGYHIETSNPLSDTILTVEALYRDQANIWHASVRQVHLRNMILNVHVDSLHILGPDRMQNNATQQYRARAVFSNGTQQDVLALWESSSPGLHIDQEGRASSGEPMSNFFATLKATLQFNQVKTVASKTIEIERTYIVPRKLEISGPKRIVELTETVFSAYMYWSDNSVTKVECIWSSTRFSISEDGLFNAGSVDSPVSVEITARARGFSTSVVVSVYEKPIEIEHLTVVGPENLKEGDIGQYRAFAHFSDNRDVEIDCSWSIVDTPANVEIQGNGRMRFREASGIVEVRARYDSGSHIFTHTKPVVLIPTPTIISGLVISGPSEVIEGQRVSLQATALYTNGTTETVQPIWETRSPDPINFPDVEADVVSPGVVQGRYVDQDMPVLVVARYFREVAVYPMIVKNYERPGPYVPLNYEIVGPNQIDVNEIGSYSLMVEFDNGCNQRIAVSNDWSLDVSRDIATIDSNGFLQSQNQQSALVTISAHWECQGNVIDAQLQVRIVANDSPLSSLHIIGPDVVDPQTHTDYTLELLRRGTDTPEIPDEDNVTWSLVSQVPYVRMNDKTLHVLDVDPGTVIEIEATYRESNHSVSATKLVTVDGVVGPRPPEDENPFYGFGPGGITDFESAKEIQESTHDLGMLDVYVPDGKYLYYLVPVDQGLLLFKNPETMLEGGMNGATWPADGTIGTEFGPLTVIRTRSDGSTSEWYLYRSDFPALHETRFIVSTAK